MGDVINLNRFRKKKAREEKEKGAERNRRFHGRTKEERARDELQKRQLEEKLDGAFLVRDDINLEDVPGSEAADQFEQLEEAAERAIPISELGRGNQDE